MNKEERIKVYAAYGKLAAAWLELGQVMVTLTEDGDAERLRKGKYMVQEGLDVIVSTLDALE